MSLASYLLIFIERLSRAKLGYRYMLACLNSAQNIIECGTSFGVSTIYLALAASRNARGLKKSACGVITIEKNPVKIAKAKEIWAEAGPQVEEWVDSREGDLMEVLNNDKHLPETVDLLFLDGMYSNAMPSTSDRMRC